MVSTMYSPEAKLDSPLLAPARSLCEIKRRRSLTRYDLEPPTPLLPRRRLGGDFSSTMRFRNQSSQTVAEGSTIPPVRRVPTSIKEARTHTFYLYYNKPKSSVCNGNSFKTIFHLAVFGPSNIISVYPC